MEKQLGNIIARIGTATVLLWIGIYKFTPTEAKDIVGVVKDSPLMFWMYDVFEQQIVSNLIGAIEIFTAILILLSPFSSRAGLIGGFLGTITFVLTLSFLASSGGMFTNVDGLWVPNFFIIKDIALLGISIQLLIQNKNAFDKKSPYYK